MLGPEASPMELTSTSFADGAPIPPRCAFARMDPEAHFALSDNENPQLAWRGVPEATRSFALLVVDSDVPSVGDDVNQEEKRVRADLPRVDFVHWVMIDVPADVREIAAGACSSGVTPRGKREPAGPRGARQGRNDYGGWFAGDPGMAGTYLGYDGPAPPWNDERLHRYRFELVALDVPRLDVPPGDFGIDDVRRAMEGHVLARATSTGTYTLNPELEP
jgi:Raf kinase inhibitor-like YbhB/YbcL family protein